MYERQIMRRALLKIYLYEIMKPVSMRVEAGFVVD